VLVVRGGDGLISACHNHCRHRGTRLCDARQGTVGGAIQCPYHAWTYGLDGALRRRRT
jgi:Rieske 2Fe-2S family protein